MTTNETTHTHEWTINHAKGITECPCGAQTTGVPITKPDALTRLEQVMSAFVFHHTDDRMMVEARISDARKEMEALRDAKGSLETLLALTQETCNRLSGKSSETLRQGQQQGRVELACEIHDAMVANGHAKDWVYELLEDIIDEDAGQ